MNNASDPQSTSNTISIPDPSSPGALDRETVVLWNNWLAKSPYKKAVLTISTIIGPQLIYVFGIILLVYALIAKNWDPFFSFWGTCLFGLAIFLPIKLGIARRRPFLKDARIIRLDPHTHKTSFPSGHSFWVSLIFMFMGVSFGFPWWGIILLYDLSIVVSLFRVALGAHYPTDLMMGHLLSPLCLLVYLWLINPFWLALVDLVLFS
jgi:membrane-associated phospholipid phosphatase